jgi:alkanesulfonate monooxygenase SsuD/methylene tetrahydromethanopterin reductase-like flavin-dependent oxidoreductase (luciferase family)
MGRGFGLTAAVDHGVVAEVAGEAERLGYSSIWFNDIPAAPGLASVAAAAAATSEIFLGVGVIPLDTRPPAMIREQLLGFGVAPDRLWLGVGSGHGPDPLERVRAGVANLQGLASRIVVGALGPRMAALAGETGGVLLNWMTPEYAATAASWTLDAATAAGLPRPALAAYVRCGFSSGAIPTLEAELARYVGNKSFEQHVRRMGVSGRDSCVIVPDAEALQAGIAPYESVLDETIVRAITPTDSPDDVLALLRACAP